jgi:hypothetical protein
MIKRKTNERAEKRNHRHKVAEAAEVAERGKHDDNIKVKKHSRPLGLTTLPATLDRIQRLPATETRIREPTFQRYRENSEKGV